MTENFDKEPTVEEAIANVTEAFRDFEKQTPEMQMQLRSLANTLREKLAQAEARLKERENAAAASQRENARARKAVRDELIPQWCRENLQPGMIVKVKANSATKFREIESVHSESLTGRHVRYVRRRNLETLEFAHELKHEGYITGHLLKNVQGVVLRSDSQGKPVVTPIMELIEGA